MRRREFITLGAAACALAAAGNATGNATGNAAAKDTAGGGTHTAPRILLFGDSLTEGYGLPPAQGLVAQLQDWLDRRGIPASITNAGLSGDTTYGGRVRIGWALRSAHDAVIVELGGNDLLMGFPLREVERNLDAILKRAKRGDVPVLLIGIAPPQSAISADRNQVIAMWQRLAARHGVTLLPDLYGPLWRQPQRDLPRYVQEDRIHLSALGVALAVQDLGPLVAQLVGRVKAGTP